MRVPLGWLAEWLPLPPLDALRERLTLGGLEVEGVERLGPDFTGLRVGHVLERTAHPNADRLSLCRVDVGEAAPIEVVCGAPNVAAGQKVAVALPGVRLPDGRKLERSKIRGVVSNGMILSAREIGLGDDHAGILVLDPAAPVGAPLAEALASGETVLEIALTTNRGDCASLLGLAREVRAHFGGAITLPPCEPALRADLPAGVRVRVDDPDGCHRYVGRVVRGVRVGPSPDRVRRRLEAAGLRSINNVVDATNLVLLELGQPLHAFDLDRLRGGEVRVRSATAGEKIRTLDGVDRELAAEDLVIADAERAIAIAGVMGGAESEVHAATTNLLIESAQFRPGRVRRTSRRLGLKSEASYRFERGVDREGVRRAADRCAQLITELAGGSVAADCLDVAGSPPAMAPEIRLDPARVNRLLGSEFRAEDVRGLLARVEVVAEPAPDGTLRCRVPSHRNDLSLPEDLVEEVARIHGYDRIPIRLPLARLASPGLPPARRIAERARDALVAAGLTEVMTLAFMPPGDLDRLDLGLDDPRRRTVRVLNPISEEESRLRSTVLPSLLRVAREGQARRYPVVRIFETSRSFHAGGPGGFPEEPYGLSVLLVREGRTSLWEPAAPPPLFFELKGLAERLLLGLGYAVAFRAGPGEPYLHPGARGAFDVDGRVVARFGELHPEVTAAFELEGECGALEVDLGALAACREREARYEEASRQPPARRDLAVVLGREVAAGEVLEAIQRTAGRELVSLDLFDRYEGPGVAEGRVSLAFRLVFQRADRAYTEAEIAALMDRVVKMLAHRFAGELR